jgi:hypothetical protein
MLLNFLQTLKLNTHDTVWKNRKYSFINFFKLTLFSFPGLNQQNVKTIAPHFICAFGQNWAWFLNLRTVMSHCGFMTCLYLAWIYHNFLVPSYCEFDGAPTLWIYLFTDILHHFPYILRFYVNFLWDKGKAQCTNMSA